MTSTTYSLDIANLTVISTDSNGERFDLNAQGNSCRDFRDLRDFVNDLCDQGAFGEEVRGDLLAELAKSYADAWERPND